MGKLLINIDDSLHKKLKLKAVMDETTMRDIVVLVLEKHLK